MAQPGKTDSEVRQLEREIEVLRSAIWAYFHMRGDRPAQAESILRSALPEGYVPVGA